jgi:hypothetical protein
MEAMIDLPPSDSYANKGETLRLINEAEANLNAADTLVVRHTPSFHLVLYNFDLDNFVLGDTFSISRVIQA